ncbi:MAG: SurA N-terminal domain-containing protein [Nitrospirota bacterium]|nr:SurA N-terminal domain-containing protein [Nitrospirota bacterium]MDH5767342.1 SurA N-terminal domain-containing protein [Nitrospirota bacterium]
MLKVLRTHAKYFYFLFFIVILSFIFWGVGTVDQTGDAGIVAEVGKYKITSEEYWKIYENVLRFYRDVYKDKFDDEMEKKMKLREKVLDTIINDKVLLIAAKDAGIQISDDELHEAITQEPAFMRNGVFDNNVYLNRLRLNRITVEAYESLKRQELTTSKIRRLIELSVDITDMGPDVKEVSGDERTAKMLRQVMLNDRKEKAIRSYIEGLKKHIKIKINTQVILG